MMHWNVEGGVLEQMQERTKRRKARNILDFQINKGDKEND
jgi:hypothetical protein